MKYFYIFILLLSGCKGPYSDQSTRNEIPHGVLRFRDDNVICYTYYEHGISCVVQDDLQ